MIYKFKYIFITFFTFFICVSCFPKKLDGESGQRIDIPELQVVTEKKSFMLYEPISVRFLIKNIYKHPISVPLGGLECGVIRFSLVNLENPKDNLWHLEAEDCSWHKVQMNPNETLLWNYDFFIYKKAEAGKFKMTAQFGDYEWNKKIKKYSDSIINALVKKEKG